MNESLQVSNDVELMQILLTVSYLQPSLTIALQ